ncbi:hypothetical protein B9057_03785 [Aestuarium zhoushanense]|nr:hypothetical protein B9057_03785 [Aestuarium zhoushanense]
MVVRGASRLCYKKFIHKNNEARIGDEAMSDEEGIKLEHVVIVVLGLFVIFLVVKFLSALIVLVPLTLVLVYTSPRIGLIISGSVGFVGLVAGSLIPDLWFVQGTQDSISFAAKMALGGVVVTIASFWSLKNPTKWQGWQQRIVTAIDRVLKKIGFISDEKPD